MKKLFILVFIGLIWSAGFSQENTDDTTVSDSKITNFAGFNVGALTGIGFSYRFMYKKIGIQITGIPAGEKNDFFASGGATLLYQYYSSDDHKVNLFAYGSGSVFYTFHKYTKQEYYRCNDPCCPEYESTCLRNISVSEEQYKYNVGIGTGIDIRIAKRLSLNVMLGYGVYDIQNNLIFNIDGGGALYFLF
jgi:hypothetical protein